MMMLRLSLFLSDFHPTFSYQMSDIPFSGAFDKQMLFTITRKTHHFFRKVCSPAQCGSALFKKW